MKKNYFKSLAAAAILISTPLAFTSCDDIVGQEDNPVASYIQWQANTDEAITLKIGDTKIVKATAVSSAIIVYESEDTKVAKVDPVTGEITAIGVGETNINAVVSGASTAGQGIFIPEKVTIKVTVKDGKAKLTAVKDPVIQYTANKDSIIDLSKLFTAYPEIGTGNDQSQISYSAFTYNYNSGTQEYDKTNYTIPTSDASTNAFGYRTNNEFKLNGKLGLAMGPDDIADTLYVVGTISKATATNDYDYTTNPAATKDTVKIIINKSIAYINKEGKREILTADKYEELPQSNTIEAGTYYVKNLVSASDITVKGDVTLIFANAMYLNSITDETDNATLNVFGEAIQDGSVAGKYIAYKPYISVYSNNGNAISNFATINIYAGEIFTTTAKTNTGAIVKVKNLNVLGGKLEAKNNSTSGYAISLPEGGKLTVNGGEVVATGAGSDADYSYAIIGDVDVLKGKFTAISNGYRAVKGNLTKGEGIKLYDAHDAEITTATNNSKKVTTTQPAAQN